MDRLRTHLTQGFVVRGSHELIGDPGFHGHDYNFYVTAENLSREDLFFLGNEQIVKIYDKTNLNHHFSSTSGEILCRELYQRLKKQIGENLVRVSLKETQKNYFYYGR